MMVVSRWSTRVVVPLAALLAALAPALGRAQGTVALNTAAAVKTSTVVTPPSSKKDDAKISVIGSLRLRVDDFNWFPTSKANGAYSFVGSLLRVGVARTSSTNDFTAEVAQPTLIGLPTKAAASGAVGSLGPGASYYSANHSQDGSLYIKQLFDRVKWAQGEANVSVK